jgi:DNA excision repair protein ERCC-3
VPYQPSNPLMIQSDMTVLLEVNHPQYEEVRNELSAFAELEKSPEHIHTYRITPLSLWNAASSGLHAHRIVSFIEQYSKFDVAPNVIRDIKDYCGRFGILELVQEEGLLYLTSSDPLVLREVLHYKSMGHFAQEWMNDRKVRIAAANRGILKQELIKLGYPAKDLAGYKEGAPLALQWREMTRSDKPFSLRAYQQQSADSFYAGGSAHGGSGVLVLPCGAGKTVIGLASAIAVQSEVLVLTSSVTAARQWIREFLDKTTISEDQIGEYSGESKQLCSVTVATYQIVSYRKSKQGEFEHLALFSDRNWGLVIYDEVHLLPAPVFRITADLQAKRRLGLTATLVREDGMEKDVFSLIGPKKFDLPWKELEREGWIATARCTEIRVPLTYEERSDYAMADSRSQARIAAEASQKIDVVKELVQRHDQELTLVIGQYLDQLASIAEALSAPLITGKMPTRERDRLYEQFRTGEIRLLIVSKVANFAIDLPDASVAIQVSGQFGSRQEEAQRLGRILRPKSDGAQAHFYSLVTRDTKEQDFAMNRQRFLTEQGYQYTITDYDAESESQQPAQETGGADVRLPEKRNGNLVSLQAYRQQKLREGG